MRIAVKWGIILGVAVIVWTLAIHMMGFYTTRISAGLIADNVAIVLPVAAVILALLERRRTAGSLTIGQSVVTGLIVGLVSAPITAAFFWIYHHYMNPGWNDVLIQHAIEQGSAKGTSQADIDTQIANLRRSATDVSQITGAFIGSTVIGTLLGLLGGAVLRRRPAA